MAWTKMTPEGQTTLLHDSILTLLAGFAGAIVSWADKELGVLLPWLTGLSLATMIVRNIWALWKGRP